MWGWVDEGWAFPGVAPAGTSRVRAPGRGIEVVRSGAVDSVQSSTCNPTSSLPLVYSHCFPPSLSVAHTPQLSFGSETAALGGGVAGGESALRNPVRDLAPPGASASLVTLE